MAAALFVGKLGWFVKTLIGPRVRDVWAVDLPTTMVLMWGPPRFILRGRESGKLRDTTSRYMDMVSPSPVSRTHLS